ncbi:hypothetical protein CEY12_14075 [Chryseobacterium sp. T16E-39]|uniref:hypothetical protein n=1 Tax=Chryseobacterium sp. T16E-39 TaxID=2015076 RepID=UPI000B5B476B|nr:hypothetical protein [Chryseobacterium sp. T16E-39]ASK31164.1 hypothetical protein CEY12_14075 [Chryseobacterium sp. T16E-39]
MKNLFFVAGTFSILFISCSKREPAPVDDNQNIKMQYDTTAIDSFSAGATSVDIVRQIRMSSQRYQDSLKEALRIQKEEKRIKEELEKENKKKQEEEKKKTEKEDKEKAPVKASV